MDGTVINNNSILNFTNEAAAGFQEVDFGNGAMEINADDIESVTVLKGPAGAALSANRISCACPFRQRGRRCSRV